MHGEGVRLLEQAAAALDADVAIYGYGASRLAKTSPLRDRYRGEAWGLDMYRVLAGARIALNRHIAAAEGYANNMRLYEATGVGAALLTDAGRNLGELFEPGVEVATYRDPDGLVAAARSLLEDEADDAPPSPRQARRGRSADHTYDAQDGRARRDPRGAAAAGAASGTVQTE